MAKDWMTFYYAHPEPERFVEEVRNLSRLGILADPERAFPAIVFLSAVIAENGQRVPTWFDALLDLDSAERLRRLTQTRAARCETQSFRQLPGRSRA